MKNKVKVKLIKTPKDVDSFLEEILCVEQFQRELEEKLKDMFHDFEVYLLKEAIKLKSRVVYVVSHTECVDFENGARIDTIYASFSDKDLANFALSKAKEKDSLAIMMDYHFDKLLDMSDNEFDEFPNLGVKGLQRKYRQVMREVKKNKNLQKKHYKTSWQFVFNNISLYQTNKKKEDKQWQTKMKKIITAWTFI